MEAKVKRQKVKGRPQSALPENENQSLPAACFTFALCLFTFALSHAVLRLQREL
jgi:hypothetical protein